MAEDRNVKVNVATGGSMGIVWFMGWLFTIGLLKLAMPKALYALLLWPYYIGQHFAR
jgi:hypothetical protein